ncbi:hypothetical protein ACP4OV_017077 [Aristida adscensionis]
MPVAANETEQATSAASARGTLKPELFMAARRGDSNRLKELLGLNHDPVVPTFVAVPLGEEALGVVLECPAAAPSSGAAAASPPLRLRDGVTAGEGHSLLHVVAAAGDGEEFLECARVMIHGVSCRLLVARSHKGDTPLHCAAGAGNADMVACLIAHVNGSGMTVNGLVRMQNKCGETALHHAVRACSKPCVDQLMSVDPQLARIPSEEDEGDAATSPLYLAISWGHMEIARQLLHKTRGKLSYSGPHGRNVLHAAVSRGQGSNDDLFGDDPKDPDFEEELEDFEGEG